jgi:ABC-type transport system involved in multi-copper enzyme maturation permease subunit
LTNAPVSLYIITILLALGGILAEKRKGALLVTLSLPIERWNWVLTHAGMTAALTFILAFVSWIGTVFGSLCIGKVYPANVAFTRVLGLWLACFPLVGLSLALNSYFHSGIKSAMVLMPIYLIGPQMTGFMAPGFYRWCPWQLADTTFLRNDNINWRALLVSLSVGIACTVLAAFRFRREET